MIKELDQFLQSTDIKDKYEVSLIDLLEDDLSPYENEREVIDKGYQLPITFIAGRAAFSGKIDNKKAYLVLKKM